MVEKLGAGVSDLKIGDRVAYPSGPLGSYARHRNFPANKLVPIPDDIPDEIAAGSLMRGMTAQYLLKQTFEVKPGMTVLIHAAAGGVGQIACQWAQALGATVIGTAGSEAKCRLARPFCDHVIDYTNEHFAERVHLLTGNKGVPVVYDASARPPLRARWPVWRHAGCWSALAMPRASAAVFAQSAGQQGLALSHPPHAGQLRQHARRITGHGG